MMSVSAYWHGIAPGYFGAFLTMIFVMFAEDLMRSTVKQRLPEKFHVYYDWYVMYIYVKKQLLKMAIQ